MLLVPFATSWQGVVKEWYWVEHPSKPYNRLVYAPGLMLANQLPRVAPHLPPAEQTGPQTFTTVHSFQVFSASSRCAISLARHRGSKFGVAAPLSLDARLA